MRTKRLVPSMNIKKIVFDSFRRLIRRIPSPGKLIRDKKGVSSLFIAIFIAMLALLLISVLFFGLTMTNLGLSQYIRSDQEKSQENIDLYRITSTSDDAFITSLQVLNTGSITVKIRALYIDNSIICDPSDPAILGQGAYIEPKENISIPLFPKIYLTLIENLDAQWTVTTERGTRSSEEGINLWKSAEQSAYTPDKFYFGPLMLSFDLFHWKSGDGPWIPGWSIPVKTKFVTWRVSLTNIDPRTITLTELSSFSLVGNTNLDQKQVWYIDPENSDMTLVPGKLRSVSYAWDRPVSTTGAKLQELGEFSADITCKNFLLFTGYFTEANGTKTPFGQTIPFEAVLITDETIAATVTLTADPSIIENDGMSYSIITATVKDSKGNPVSNEWVDLFTSAGTLSQYYVNTDSSGQIQVTLTSSFEQTIANIYAYCQGKIGTCTVAFTPAA